MTQNTETDEFGHVRLGGIAETLAGEIEARTGVGRATWSLAICSAAAPPRPSTVSSRPATA